MFEGRGQEDNDSVGGRKWVFIVGGGVQPGKADLGWFSEIASAEATEHAVSGTPLPEIAQSTDRFLDNLTQVRVHTACTPPCER